MARWYRLSLMTLILFVVWGCGSKTSSIEGQVVDGKGAPMAKVKIIAKQVQPIKGYEQVEATTGGDGKFAFKGLFPTSAYEIFPYSEAWTSSVRLKMESGPEGHTRMLPAPIKIRFTKAKDNVITDSATGLEWYVGPDRDTDWHQAKSWTQSLTAAGSGWRMPTIPELKALYQPGAGNNNMDLIFQTTALVVWSGQVRDASWACFSFNEGQVYWFRPLDTSAYAHHAFAVRSRR
jgi:hypothetical protein